MRLKKSKKIKKFIKDKKKVQMQEPTIISSEVPDAATQRWVWDHLVSDNQRNLLIRTMRTIANGEQKEEDPEQQRKRTRQEEEPTVHMEEHF